jgi:hypothetical protein
MLPLDNCNPRIIISGIAYWAIPIVPTTSVAPPATIVIDRVRVSLLLWAAITTGTAMRGGGRKAEMAAFFQLLI